MVGTSLTPACVARSRQVICCACCACCAMLLVDFDQALSDPMLLWYKVEAWKRSKIVLFLIHFTGVECYAGGFLVLVDFDLLR